MKYNKIHTENDVIKERYIEGAYLVGEYDIPQVDAIHAHLDGLHATPLNLANKDMKPKSGIVHCFLNDDKIEPLYANPLKYYDVLKNFKYIVPCDFSFYYTMPKAVQIHQIYKMRAVHNFLAMLGLQCIPVVTWADEESYDFCFDGLPHDSTLAVSTNGCHFKKGKECYVKGFKEMVKRLEPLEVLVIGRAIETGADVNVVYMDNYSQQMKKRIKES